MCADLEFDELPIRERLWELESMRKEVLSTATLEKVYYVRPCVCLCVCE